MPAVAIRYLLPEVYGQNLRAATDCEQTADRKNAFATKFGHTISSKGASYLSMSPSVTDGERPVSPDDVIETSSNRISLLMRHLGVYLPHVHRPLPREIAHEYAAAHGSGGCPGCAAAAEPHLLVHQRISQKSNPAVSGRIAAREEGSDL